MSKAKDTKGKAGAKKPRTAKQEAATRALVKRNKAAAKAAKSGAAPKKAAPKKKGNTKGNAKGGYVTAGTFVKFRSDIREELDQHKAAINDHGGRIDKLAATQAEHARRIGAVEGTVQGMSMYLTGRATPARAQTQPMPARAPATQPMPRTASGQFAPTIAQAMPVYN